MIHVCAPYVRDINNDSWKYLITWASSVRFPVNLFYMISGALILNPNKEFEIRKFFKKHFLKILLIFVVWSFIYAFINVTPLISDNEDTSEILSVFFTNWAKGEYHMGFLIWLLAFYIAVPIIVLYVRK